MKNFKTLLFSLIFFSLLPTISSAQKGCIGSIIGWYYSDHYEDDGTVPLYSFSSRTAEPTAEYCDGRDASQMGKLKVTTNIKCVITGVPIFGRVDGTIVEYRTVQCPIDDYIPAVVLAMAGAGFFLIRRRDLAI